MKYVGYGTVIVLFMVLGNVFNGYALSILWGWFIVPTFGVVQINIPQAIGISMIVAYLTRTINVEDEENKKPFGEKLFNGIALSILKPTVALAFGWIVNHWM